MGWTPPPNNWLPRFGAWREKNLALADSPLEARYRIVRLPTILSRSDARRAPISLPTLTASISVRGAFRTVCDGHSPYLSAGNLKPGGSICCRWVSSAFQHPICHPALSSMSERPGSGAGPACQAFRRSDIDSTISWSAKKFPAKAPMVNDRNSRRARRPTNSGGILSASQTLRSMIDRKLHNCAEA